MEKRLPCRWRTAAMLALGAIVLAMVVVPPAGAHFKASISHIAHHMKHYFYTRSQSNKRFVAKNATIRGSFFMTDEASDSSEETGAQISFGRALAAAPTTHFIQEGDTPPAECPGTPSLPKAQAGHLCIYEAGGNNESTRGACSNDAPAVTCPGASRMGASLYLFSADPGRYQSWGTWAVTPS
jgi:hypothetical protein